MKTRVKILVQRLVIEIDIFHGFPRYLEAITGTVPYLGHDCFLPRHFHFIIH